MNEKPLSSRQQKTRLAFINALLRLVVEKGLDQVTVIDIANEANYGRATYLEDGVMSVELTNEDIVAVTSHI